MVSGIRRRSSPAGGIVRMVQMFSCRRSCWLTVCQTSGFAGQSLFKAVSPIGVAYSLFGMTGQPTRDRECVSLTSGFPSSPLCPAENVIMAPPMPLSSGTKLGPYEIQSSLGAGGMGEVYRARDTRLDRTVAIKVLPSHLSD